MNVVRRLARLLLHFSAVLMLAAVATAADWPDWRGPMQDRHYDGPPLVTSFDPETGENVVWRHEEGGISSPVIMGGRLYTLVRHAPDTAEEAEKVICLDARTGKKLWENIFNVYLSDVPAERVGWSAVVADPESNTVFAHGVCGVFTAIDATTGKTQWRRSLHEEFGFLSTYGGRTNVPIVFEDLVIASAVVTGWGDTARPAHRFLGMDKATGEVRWMNGTKELPEDTTYSTPSLAVLDGQAALVFGSSDGSIWNFQPRTGKAVWNFKLSRRGINTPPLVDGETVYVSQSEENLDNTSMGVATAFKATGSGDITATHGLWQKKGVMDGRSMPVVLGDRVYFTEDGAKLFVFDKATGKPIGRAQKLLGTIVRGSPLVANGKLYICSTSGFHVIEPTADGFKFAHRMRLDEEDEVTASPIAADGLLYLVTGARIYCIGDKTAAATPPLPAARAPHAPTRAESVSATTRGGTAGEPAAWVQVVPAEAQIAAGETLALKVRLYDAQGRLVKESPATFSATAGSVSNEGRYTAPEGVHAGAIITAKVGDLEGKARIRSMPPLPWRFDFEEIALAADPKGGPPRGEPPLPWVGMRYRHVVREVDGSKCLVKVTTIPKGTRSQGWIGPIELHDYAIQADIRAAESGVGAPGDPTTPASDSDADAFAKAFGTAAALEKARMPDIGLIAQRYTLDMMGASQQLQLRSWPPQVATHFSKTIPFPWEAGRWYTMKFEARTKGDDAVLRGKVWPRGEPEPEAWTIEAVHEKGNCQGSPGFFGNSKDSEIYIDNVSVEAVQ
jgi:outer membrane protein assembly factor BamB